MQRRLLHSTYHFFWKKRPATTLGPIKSKTRGDVYILVANDRFSKWPTALIYKNTDTRTVMKI